MINRRTFLSALLAAAGQQLLGSPAGAAAVPSAAPLRVAVISDLNHSYGTIGYDPPILKAVRQIIALKPDIVLCTGDMIAGQRTSPKLKKDRLESMWHSFFQTVVQPLAKAGIPLAAAPGNHDASASPGFQLERDVFGRQWQQNRDALSLLPGSSYPFYYAFTLKDVLFVSLDVTVTSPMPAAQKTWLTTVLTNADKYRARIVFGHIPFAPLTVGRERSFLRDKDLEPLLTDTNVSVYLSGHQHGFYPFYHNKLYCVGQAAIGSGPRRLIGTSRRSPRAFTLMEIAPDGTLDIHAWTGPDFTEILQRSTLPEHITTGGMTIFRDDLKK